MPLIARYETRELIGKGSMGEVYRAQDIKLDRDIALKILQTGPNFDPELRERFYREARAGARLKHPNITAVYDLGEENGIPYLVMELLHGADLRHYIEERRPVPLVQKVELLLQVCDGLAHAHRQGIIHRDLKPSNIFIDKECQAKILDFGIARLPTSSLTQAGKVLGTPNYMAPEQIRSQPCDQRSDLFSAAIVFYEFLVFVHPFQSAFIPKRIAEGEPDSLYEKDPLIPRALEQLLRKALQKRPEDRVQTAEEFAAGLRDVLEALRKIPAAAKPGTGSTLHGTTTTSDGDGSASSAAAAEEDSRGARVSEFIRLVQAFEQDVRLEDGGAAARKILAEMREVAAVDGRFVTPLQEYERQFRAAFPDAPELPSFSVSATNCASTGTAGKSGVTGAAAAADYPATEVFAEPLKSAAAASEAYSASVCRSCGYGNRAEAVFCHNCGERLASSAPASATLPKPQAEGLPEQRVAPPSAAAPTAATRLRVKFTALPSFLRGRRTALSERVSRYSKRQAGLAIAVVLVLAIAITSYYYPRTPSPIPAEPAVGQATVMAAQAPLLEQPNPSANVYLSIPRGVKLNLLSRLASRDQQWVRVQVVSTPGQNSPPGYVQTKQLGDWASNDPSLAWIFVQMMQPSQDASEAEQRGYAEKLKEFSERFARSPEAAQAEMQDAELFVSFAAQAKAEGKTPSQYAQDIEEARASITRADAGKTDAQWPSRRDKLRAALDQLAKVEPAPPTQPRENPLVRPFVVQAWRAWAANEFDQGIMLVDRALALSPNDAEARMLKAKLVRAKQGVEELERRHSGAKPPANSQPQGLP